MSHPLSLDIGCLNCSLQSRVSAVDVCYHTLCNPDNVVFKPIASQLSSNFPALWPAGAECHFLAPRRRKSLFSPLSISLLNLFPPQDAFWSFSVWFVLAAGSGSRHCHLMAGCLRASTLLFLFLWSVKPRRTNSQVLLTRTQAAEKL